MFRFAILVVELQAAPDAIVEDMKLPQASTRLIQPWIKESVILTPELQRNIKQGIKNVTDFIYVPYICCSGLKSVLNIFRCLLIIFLSFS